ncbi:MAG: hypothetical protein ACFFDT_21890, partial [Candidatus Hodarchaeota archaeon]
MSDITTQEDSKLYCTKKPNTLQKFKVLIPKYPKIILMFVLFLIVLLGSGFLFINSDDTNKPINTKPESEENTFGISIQNDSAFITHGFPGRGIESDPYQIAHYSFVDVYYGIYIHGTTKYFIIEDSVF